MSPEGGEGHRVAESGGCYPDRGSNPRTNATKVNPINLVREILEGQQGDVLLAMLRTMLHHVMEAEVTERTGAVLRDRSADREVQRDGYRERPFETWLSTVELAIPKLGKGTHLPGFVTPRRRCEQAFVNVVACAYVDGVSTQKVEDLSRRWARRAR